MFEAVCQAVGYAHARRVIHRDIKPANVMVGAFGEVQVMDWGLSKVLDDAESTSEAIGSPPPASVAAYAVDETQAWTKVSPTPEGASDTKAGSLVGTPAFIPPEQAVGDIAKVNERSDVFGLGALLAVILTGKPPMWVRLSTWCVSRPFRETWTIALPAWRRAGRNRNW